MGHEVIRSFESLNELGTFIDAGARDEPNDEVPFRDEAGRPLTAEQMLELARQVERDTGDRLIFGRGEQP